MHRTSYELIGDGRGHGTGQMVCSCGWHGTKFALGQYTTAPTEARVEAIEHKVNVILELLEPKEIEA